MFFFIVESQPVYSVVEHFPHFLCLCIPICRLAHEDTSVASSSRLGVWLRVVVCYFFIVISSKLEGHTLSGIIAAVEQFIMKEGSVILH